MKNCCLFILLTLVSATAFAQIEKGDEYLEQPMDTTLTVPIQLAEVYINPKQAQVDAEMQKAFLILQRRVYKVYPYAKAASARLAGLNEGMAKLKTSKEKKKYQKIVEEYVKKQFEPNLKKMSRKDGQILVKLIYRQTGSSTFDLIKEYKSGWKAFWSQNTAKLFDINLKMAYQPMEVNEDYLIETILRRAFAHKRLEKQDPAFPIDYNEVAEHWETYFAHPKNQSTKTKD